MARLKIGVNEGGQAAILDIYPTGGAGCFSISFLEKRYKPQGIVYVPSIEGIVCGPISKSDLEKMFNGEDEAKRALMDKIRE